MSAKNDPSPLSKARAARPNASWSLATRLTLWYTGSAFALVALASGILYWGLVANLEREDDEELADKVRILRELVRGPAADLPSARRQVELGWASRQYAQIYARVLDGDSTTILETPGMSALLGPELFPVPVAGEIRPPAGI